MSGNETLRYLFEKEIIAIERDKGVRKIIDEAIVNYNNLKGVLLGLRRDIEDLVRQEGEDLPKDEMAFGTDEGVTTNAILDLLASLELSKIYYLDSLEFGEDLIHTRMKDILIEEYKKVEEKRSAK